MAHTLQQFARQCHDLLKAQPGPAGRQKVADLLKEVLVDKQFVEANLGPNVGEREVIYEDPELGFCIVAHNYQGAKAQHRTITPTLGRFMARRAERQRCVTTP